MAIVGPRPERPEFVDLLAQQIPVLPAAAGRQTRHYRLGQINHKYGDTDLDAMIKLEYDLYYIKHVARGARFLHHLSHHQSDAAQPRRAIALFRVVKTQ